MQSNVQSHPGLALVIDIEVYENNVQETRTGSNVDVENLSSLLKVVIARCTLQTVTLHIKFKATLGCRALSLM